MSIRTAVAAVVALGLGACTSRPRSALHDTAEAKAHEAELSHPIPIFSVSDLRASERYFRDALGFKVEWEDGSPPDFAAVSRADATIFMCQGCQGRPGTWIMIFTRDVDQLYQEFKRKGAMIRRPPADERWRLREMHVADPDGHVIRFASATKH